MDEVCKARNTRLDTACAAPALPARVLRRSSGLKIMAKLMWEQVAAWRMRRHHLVERAPAGSMLAVAGRLCGLHAQVMSSAELMVWARVEGHARGDVQRALWEERTLIKTWAMRGTLHLLPAFEWNVWHGALRENPRYSRPALLRRFGMTVADLDRLTAEISPLAACFSEPGGRLR